MPVPSLMRNSMFALLLSTAASVESFSDVGDESIAATSVYQQASPRKALVRQAQQASHGPPSLLAAVIDKDGGITIGQSSAYQDAGSSDAILAETSRLDAPSLSASQAQWQHDMRLRFGADFQTNISQPDVGKPSQDAEERASNDEVKQDDAHDDAEMEQELEVEEKVEAEVEAFAKEVDALAKEEVEDEEEAEEEAKDSASD